MDWYYNEDDKSTLWEDSDDPHFTLTYTNDYNETFERKYRNIGKTFSEDKKEDGIRIHWFQNEISHIEDLVSFSQGADPDPSFFESWSESDNLFAEFSYDFINDISVVGQAILDIKGPENELTGGRGVYNLNGTSNFKIADSFVNLVGSFAPMGKTFGKIPKGLGIGANECC